MPISIHSDNFTIDNYKDIITFLWSVRTKWRYIGVALGMDVETLNEIEKSRLFIVADCFTDLISRWLQHTVPYPTRTALAIALQSPLVEAPNLAQKLLSIGMIL